MSKLFTWGTVCILLCLWHVYLSLREPDPIMAQLQMLMAGVFLILGKLEAREHFQKMKAAEIIKKYTTEEK